MISIQNFLRPFQKIWKAFVFKHYGNNHSRHQSMYGLLKNLILPIQGPAMASAEEIAQWIQSMNAKTSLKKCFFSVRFSFVFCLTRWELIMRLIDFRRRSHSRIRTQLSLYFPNHFH